MNVFLLLSALIASLTGISRSALPAVEMVQSQQVGARSTPAAAQQAIALVRVAVPAPRPDGYIAPAVLGTNAVPSSRQAPPPVYQRARE